MKKLLDRFQGILWILFVFIIPIFQLNSVNAAVIHVPQDYSQIQSAIDASLDQDTILISDGLYFGEGNRDIDTHGKHILIRSENGSFRCVIDCQSSSLGFRFQNGETNDTVLEGLTIRNGNNTESGGAIYCYASSPVIRNCVFRDNNSASNGGAIFCLSLASPEIINCIFSTNTARTGSAVYCDFYSDPTICNSTFSGNYSTQGGAVQCSYHSSPTLLNSILWSNLPRSIYVESGEPAVNFCDVQGGYIGDSNINENPLFSSGYDGEFYLSQELVDETSPCVNAGSSNSDQVCFEWSSGLLCMSDLTTSVYLNGDAQTVDMGFHYPTSNATPAIPTSTPTFTPTPTTTPVPTNTEIPTITPTSPPEFSIQLSMPSSYFSPGDPCNLTVELQQHLGAALGNAPLFVFLDYQGHYWFWPNWSDELDFRYVTIPEGISGLTIIDTFYWPDTGSGGIEGLTFWACLTDSDLEEVIGGIDDGIAIFSFGYGP